MRFYCLYCGGKISKSPSQMKRTKHGAFCDRECFHKWQHEVLYESIRPRKKKPSEREG
jgi:hypothetical protein